MKMVNLAIFASGAGSNAKKILEYFSNNTGIEVVKIVSNNPDAYVLEIAKQFNIESIIISKSVLKSEDFIKMLNDHKIDLIVLAGFLLKIPKELIEGFQGEIINIHPALLPKYGGKGMYGMHVHQAVKDANDTETGITIHYVNENYDEGKVILQEHVNIQNNDTIEMIANKVHQLEYQYFAPTIEKICKLIQNN
jgi:phosphoribosylglycinamide formyltransferase-1